MIIIIMGVAGSGKTTVGKLLAERLGYGFRDADDFHSQANRQKMSSGIPLGDDDRHPWISGMRKAIEGWLAENENMVLACSALKDSYRQMLKGQCQAVKIVYLKGDISLIQQRLAVRENHFMNRGLLPSQFADLEPPLPSEAIVMDVALSPEEIVCKIQAALSN